MKNLIAITSMAALSLFSSFASAENTAYIGIGAGTTLTSIDEIGADNTVGSVDKFDETTASKIFVGFKPDKHIIIEASLFTTGEGDAKVILTPAVPPALAVVDDVTVESKGLNIAMLYAIPDALPGITTAFGGGIYIFDTEITDPTVGGVGSSKADSHGASLHGRVEYVAFNTLAFRLDLDVFIGVKAFDENKAVTSLTAGLAYTF